MFPIYVIPVYMFPIYVEATLQLTFIYTPIPQLCPFNIMIIGVEAFF